MTAIVSFLVAVAVFAAGRAPAHPLIVINIQTDDCADRFTQEPRSVRDTAVLGRIFGTRTLHAVRHLQLW